MAKLFQAALAVALDPDSDGSNFEVGRLPACPKCGALEVTYREVRTHITIEIDLLRPGFDGWASLAEAEKKERLRKVVDDFRTA